MSNYLPDVSLCMIVKNDATTLPDAIKSIKPFVDEIIIVDLGSSDNTVETAKKYGCKVFHFLWNNNFSSARNFALQQAVCDWIVVMDAGHIFKSPQADILKKQAAITKHLGLMVEENYYDYKGEMVAQDKLFMFRNHFGFMFSGLVFEHPMQSIKNFALKNKIVVPYGRINKCSLSYSNKNGYLEKQKDKLHLIKAAIKAEPDNFLYKFHQLLAFKNTGQQKEYEKALLEAVYNIERLKPKLNESVVGIWAQFGEWIIKDDNSSHVEKFYNGAKILNEKTKWSDIRLVWPYVKISILQKNYNKAIQYLTLCIKNGLVPPHIILSKEERITPVYQLLKLINEEKELEDFVEIVLELDNLLFNSKLKLDDLLEVLKTNDNELYSGILDILGAEEKKRNIQKTKEIKPGKQKPFISLCMIVKNEKNNLKRCLNSIKNIADEIIIVDTGSNDETVKIAEKYNSIILHHAWNEDFSEARNAGLEKANGEWILVLDADEELNLSTSGKIRHTLLNTRAEALNVIIRKYQPEDDVMRYIDEQSIRLFRNKKEYRYQNRIHSQIIPSIADSGGSFTECSVIVNNYGPQQQNEKRHKRNIPLLNEGLKEQPKDAYMLFKLAETYKSLSQWDKAREYYTKAISNPKGSISNEIKELIYLRLAQISLAKDEFKSTKKYASACLRFNAKNAMAKFIMGVTYMHLGDTSTSIRIFQELRATQKIHGLDLSDVETFLKAMEKKPADNKVMN
jgi:glycosyltransferase involved in cell wall biosynthesis